MIHTPTVLLTAVLLWALPAPAAAVDRRQFIRSLDRTMASMSAESARDARAIKAAYREHLQLLVLDQYDEAILAVTLAAFWLILTMRRPSGPGLTIGSSVARSFGDRRDPRTRLN